MKPKELIEVFDISLATWNNWISNGLVAKEKASNYELSKVVQQVYRNKNSLFAKEKSKRVKAEQRVKKLEGELLKLQGKLDQANSAIGSGSSGDGEPVEIDPALANKEQLDQLLLRKRIEKMEMDASIRKKQNIPMELLVDITSKLAVDVANTLKPILPMIKRKVPDLPASAYDSLAKEFAQLRNRLADYQLGKEQKRTIDDYEPKGYVDDD